jgi:hypothetical protein
VPSNEKQTHPRTRGRIRVRFGVDSLDHTAFTMNLSLTGLFLRTNAIFPPGKTIKVELSFPDGLVAAYAKVVWAKKVPPQMAHLLHCGMGLRLISPGTDWFRCFEAWQSSKGAPSSPRGKA